MNIFLAQTKPVLGNTEKNLYEMVKVIEKEIEKGTELVLFPELSLTGYLLEDMVYDVAISKVPEILIELSKKISIIFGAVELADDLFHYNSAFYLEDGELKHIHRKVYLPTYGLFDEGRYFKEGNSIRAFDTKFGRVGMLICEDVFHQSSSYILAQDGAHIIFTIVNSPTRLSNRGLGISDIWESICKTISVSNSCFTVMVNRVGVEDGVNFWGGSFAISPSGDMIKKLDYFKEVGENILIDKKEIVKVRFSSGSCKNEKIDLVLNELERIKKSR
ncbi:MAG: nitrilase-related carbon-nitrogen hydrolase [Cetobacterium sp.]|uniref:nitrilase-related carbon-nitrogen hydrolase n=1 Tax=Cetobacterium sp. TaxID=2071632 RepID=UPI003F39B318